MEKKLRKSSNKMISGVCAGLAEYMGMDITLARVIYAALTFFTMGLPGVILYFILAIIMPNPEA